uniref:Uncharacterized protein n=1 Tax=Rangifer tarandus platyrhynchus TaxID=3082113 RepID=A0ACB0ET21_RANTA|nr:unnamed protein product [Rangifer tarandus platyrhynchus]
MAAARRVRDAASLPSGTGAPALLELSPLPLLRTRLKPSLLLLVQITLGRRPLAPGSQQPSGGSQTGQRRARRSWAALAARPLPSTSASAVRLGRQDEAPRDPPC